ncbi:LysM peptidoglycan-binding domain-containing protein [Actinomyces sp. MRS3W]|uniref:LysM peptidoglycan-binding domain-containing protein n=1 Tax=Actinomyces sp. MRS3W TaxID=2800796 RepID=UPI0028FD6D8D|nr:LysM peptidoglycan-binding domain-containing protein [Actinomyces sp. MRS3W]MDU0348430.1 LysM peptidoglycan-binding domain-containing protein [Actinomyces sp. MRS3W]
MSALAAPLPPRLRLVPSEQGQTRAPLRSVPGSAAVRAVADVDAAAVQSTPQRPHLRLVTGGAAAPAAAPDALPLELTRRPHAPRRIRPEQAKRSAEVARPAPAGGASGALEGRRQPLEELAPTHPAVRARRQRQVRAAAVAAASVSAPARSTAPALPAAMRRLLVVGALVFAVVLALAGGIVASGFDSAPVETTTATVRPGESLWDIAVATGAGDVADTMAQIVDLNDLTTSTLQAGQTLIVPAG